MSSLQCLLSDGDQPSDCSLSNHRDRDRAFEHLHTQCSYTSISALLSAVFCSDLTDPIDVYSEWIDETEKANRVLDDDELAGRREARDRERALRASSVEGDIDERDEGDGEEVQDEQEVRRRRREKQQQEQQRERIQKRQQHVDSEAEEDNDEEDIEEDRDEELEAY